MFIYGFHDIRAVQLFEALIKAHGVKNDNPDFDPIDHLLQLHAEAMEEERNGHWRTRWSWRTTFTRKLAALIHKAHARTLHIKAFPDFNLPAIDLLKGLEELAIEYAEQKMPHTYPVDKKP